MRDKDSFWFAGVAYPLWMATIDRIRPEEPYNEDNGRIVPWFVNGLKSDSQDDAQTMGYIDHVRSMRAELEAALANPPPPPAPASRPVPTADDSGSSTTPATPTAATQGRT